MTAPAAEKEKNMESKQCFVCKKMVRDGDENEHLRTHHLGPHYFWFEGKEYRTEEPSMPTSELLRLVGREDVMGRAHLAEDRDGKFIYQSGTVDLTNKPHFCVLLPATW